MCGGGGGSCVDILFCSGGNVLWFSWFPWQTVGGGGGGSCVDILFCSGGNVLWFSWFPGRQLGGGGVVVWTFYSSRVEMFSGSLGSLTDSWGGGGSSCVDILLCSGVEYSLVLLVP